MRPQADALGQNLPGGAISSAVEHLPYKEIVTGSIPVSPISKRSAALRFLRFCFSSPALALQDHRLLAGR